MDLAKSYHNFAKEVFLQAIHIVGHFHVNRYIIDALHSIAILFLKNCLAITQKDLSKTKNY